MSLHIQKVTKSFNQTQALKEINLDIQDSEFIAILGPSGAEKPPFCGSWEDLSSPPAALCAWGNQIYSGEGHMVPVEQRDLGMVFQSLPSGLT